MEYFCGLMVIIVKLVIGLYLAAYAAGGYLWNLGIYQTSLVDSSMCIIVAHTATSIQNVNFKSFKYENYEIIQNIQGNLPVLKGSRLRKDIQFGILWVLGLFGSWLIRKSQVNLIGYFNILFNGHWQKNSISVSFSRSSLYDAGWFFCSLTCITVWCSELYVSFIDIHLSYIQSFGFQELLPTLLMILFIIASTMLWAFGVQWIFWTLGWQEPGFWLPRFHMNSLRLGFPIWLILAYLYLFGTNDTQLFSKITFWVLGGVLVTLRWIRALILTWKKHPERLFLMLFYICTFEILPILVLYQFWNNVRD